MAAVDVVPEFTVPMDRRCYTLIGYRPAVLA